MAEYCLSLVTYWFLGRHDTPEEMANDKILQQINDSHPFQSFAAERRYNIVKWLDITLCYPFLHVYFYQAR